MRAMRGSPRIIAASALLTVALPACGGGYSAWAEAPAPVMSPGASYGGLASGSAGDVMEAEYESRATSTDVDLGGQGYSGGGAPPADERPRYAQADPTGTEPRTATDARQGPLLIYTANVALAVHQVAEKQTRIEALVREVGGHLHHRGDAEITVRVPAEAFESVLAQILELGDVLSRDVSVQDVSEEFHDLQTRIRTLEAMYARVSQLLASANDVENALAVEQHLERITLELERIRGRLRFLADRVAFSTITVRFTERATVTTPTFELPFAWLRSLGLENLMRLQ